MTWTLAIGLFKRFYGPVAVVAALVFAWMAFGAVATGVQLRSDLNKTLKTLSTTQQKLAENEAEFEDLIRDYNEQARAADARERVLENQRVAAVDKVRGDYGTRVAQLDRALQLALDGLRHSGDEDRRRALKPSADSPAECRNYAADPRNLSLSDAELALRIGAAAESVAGKLAYCDGYIKGVLLKRGEQ